MEKIRVDVTGLTHCDLRDRWQEYAAEAVGSHHGRARGRIPCDGVRHASLLPQDGRMGVAPNFDITNKW